MPNKTFTPEQIVGMLRQIGVLVSQGKTVPLACKDSGIGYAFSWFTSLGGDSGEAEH